MPFDLDGRGYIRPPGRHKITRTFDADAGALPTGFTVGRSATADTGVTSAYTAASAGVPALTITGQVAPDSTTAGRRRAGLFGATIDVTKTVGVRMRAVITGGLSVTSLIPRFGWEVVSSTTHGPTVLSQTTGDVAQMFSNGTGVSTNRKMPWKWLASPIRHDITLWWLPATGEVAFTADDEAIEYYENLGSALTAGVVYPFVSIQAQATGLQAVLAVHKFEIDAYYA